MYRRARVCAIFGAMARLGAAQCIEVDGRRMQVVFDNDLLKRRSDRSGIMLGDTLMYVRASEFAARPVPGRQMRVGRAAAGRDPVRRSGRHTGDNAAEQRHVGGIIVAYRSGMTSKRGAHRGSGFLRIDASGLLDMARRCEQELGADAAAATLATALGRSRAFIVDEIARQVSAVYELDESDISQGSATYGDHQQNLNLSATAGRNSLIEITYWGRRLTVGGHFPFTPRRPRNRNYRVTTTIRRGSPKQNSARTFVPNSAKWGKLVWERTEAD